MASMVFLFRRQLRERTAQLRHQENRIIAKTALPPRLFEDPARGCGGKNGIYIAAFCNCNHTNKTRIAFAARKPSHFG